MTGGSEGIGEAFVQDLAEAGFNVTMVSRSKDKLQAAAKRVKDKVSNANCHISPLDLSKAKSGEVEKLF